VAYLRTADDEDRVVARLDDSKFNGSFLRVFRAAASHNDDRRGGREYDRGDRSRYNEKPREAMRERSRDRDRGYPARDRDDRNRGYGGERDFRRERDDGFRGTDRGRVRSPPRDMGRRAAGRSRSR
jgi:hypothetical protein